MTSKYSLGKAHVELWTDLTFKFVDMVCIITKMYLRQECCMWCNLSQKLCIFSLPLHKYVPY